MEAKDTVIHECICGRYDFVPFYSPWDVNNTQLNHCYECDAYHDGKLSQAEISFKAGIEKVVERLVARVNTLAKTRWTVEAHREQILEELRAELKEWGIEK